MEIGKKYVYKYPNIKFKDSDDNVTEYIVIVTALIPDDYENFEFGEAPYILSIQFGGDEKIFYLKYYDKPKLRGKGKWILDSIEDANISIDDLPSAISSSLNTFEHPSKRNWFIHENFGLKSTDYKKTSWKKWRDYDLLIEYNDITLLYKIVSSLIKKLYPSTDDYEFLKDMMNEQFLLNYPYKMSKSTLETFHPNYLRDLLNLWSEEYPPAGASVSE